MNSREKMVWEIKTRYGLDSPKVFSAMLQVPREKFIFKKYRRLAYEDNPVSIGHNQTMSQPYTVAFMTDLLNLKGKEKVLEIGTGSGYQAAVLSFLAKEVFTIEIIKDLSRKAQKILTKLNINNVHTKAETGEIGWPEQAPFDAILITAALESEIPKTLFDQLKTGGVLVAPIGEGDDKMMTKHIKRKSGRIEREEHGIFHFVPFIKK
jgi:protein-L-isoaspartate(D-aspartate) O-methyltransferase